MSLTKVSYSMIDGPQVSVADFGASPSSSDNTAALIAAFSASSNKTLVFESGTYVVKQLIASASNIRIIGNGATIEYSEDIADCSLDLTDAYIENITFDGSGFNIADNTENKKSGVIKAQGDTFRMFNVTFTDLHGLENQYQYGAVVNASTKSIVESCTFSNIRTRTNTANTGGFCGGYWINLDSGLSMSPSEHTVSNCLFEDIYTTQNAAGQLFPDSDGVRSYFADIATGGTAYVQAVRATTITVTGCSFVNVLKSACKIQDANCYINGCRVVINDLQDQGQTSVYTGFRYQDGIYVSVTDCSVIGKLRIGSLLVGSNTFVNNLYVGIEDVAATDQSGLVIGNVAGAFAPSESTISYAGITNFTTDGGEYSLDIYGVDEIFVDGSNLEGPIAIIHCDNLYVSNSKLDGMIQNAHRSPYTPYIKKIVFSNCYIDNASTGFYQNNILSDEAFDFVMDNVKLINAKEKLLETTQEVSIKLSNCNITVNDPSDSGRDFLELSSVSELRIYDTVITDTRTTDSPDLLIYTDNSNEKVFVDGLKFIAKTGSNYTNAIYLAGSGTNVVLRNLEFEDMPSDTYAINISSTQNPSVSNVRCNYTDAKVRFNNNGKAVINMLHGTLKTSPGHLETAGTVTVSEYNTTFF